MTVNFTLVCSLNIEKQEQVIMDEYNKGWAVRAEQEPDDEIIRSGVSPDNIRKWKVNMHCFFFKMDCECYDE